MWLYASQISFCLLAFRPCIKSFHCVSFRHLFLSLDLGLARFGFQSWPACVPSSRGCRAARLWGTPRPRLSVSSSAKSNAFRTCTVFRHRRVPPSQRQPTDCLEGSPAFPSCVCFAFLIELHRSLQALHCYWRCWVSFVFPPVLYRFEAISKEYRAYFSCIGNHFKIRFSRTIQIRNCITFFLLFFFFENPFAK